MADKKATLHWYGHPVKDEEHASNLDLKASVYQFHHGMDRHAAENKVKHEDRVERHQKAAAHHLDGMKAAHAVGNHEDAQQHHAMYSLHVKALGGEPGQAVPPEVAKWQGNKDKKHAYTFKGHGDDQFLTEPVIMSPAPLAKAEGKALKKGEPGTCPGCNKDLSYEELSGGKCFRCDTAHGQTPAPGQQPSTFDPHSDPHRNPEFSVQAFMDATDDSTCENCGNQRSPIEVKNDYCSGCAKEIDEAAAQGQANMHWSEKPSFGAASPSAKNKLVDYLKGLGIQGAQVEDVKPPLAAVPSQGTPALSAPKFGHLRIVKHEMWPFILGCWRTLAKADPAAAQGRVKQFDVRRTWLRHKHLPEEKAFDYSSWLTPAQHANGYRMFVLSHGNGNPLRVHVVHNQQKAGSASGNVDQGDLEVENYNLAHASHHDRGLEASMLNAMMGHAKSNMGADYLSHGPFTPEASGFIEAMAKPHGFQLGEPEDIDEGETPADQKPATLVSGGVKVRSTQPNRVPRSFQPKVPQWWRTAAEEND